MQTDVLVIGGGATGGGIAWDLALRGVRVVLAEMGDSTGAIDEFKHTVERDPRHADAHFLLAEEYFKRDAVAAAVAAYEQAAALSPENLTYLLRLANACFKISQYARSEEIYQKALQSVDPKGSEIHYLIGYSQRAQGKFKGAVANFEKEIALHPDHVEALANLGYAHLQLGNLEAAEPYLKRTVELRPTHAEAHLTLGQVYLRQRRYAEAQVVLQRAIDLRPDYTQAHYQLFLAYSRSGQQELAQKELELFKALEAEDKRERELRERRQQAEKP